jgi:hypothetical protein
MPLSVEAGAKRILIPNRDVAAIMAKGMG